MVSLHALCQFLSIARNLTNISERSTWKYQAVSKTVNFTKVKYPQVFCEYLDLSHNDLTSLTGNISAAFPRLKILDLSYNKLSFIFASFQRISSIYCIFSDFVQKATQLEIIQLGNQLFHYHFYADLLVHKEIIPVAFKRLSSPDNQCIKLVYYEDFEFVSHPEVYCYSNATELNKRIRTEFLFTDSDIFKQIEHCPQDLIYFIPIASNLKRINIGNSLETYIDVINYNIFQADNLWPSFCFYKNNIESIQISGKTLPDLTGFDPSLRKPAFGNLKELTVREAGPQADIAILMQFFAPHIQRLDLRNGDILFDTEIKLCDVTTELEYLDLSQTNAVNLNLDYLQGCKNLMFLNLSFTSLVSIDEKLLNYFDELVQRNGEFKLDMTGNTFHCFCHNNHTSTIYWIKHTSVKIMDINSLLCHGHNGVELLVHKDWKIYEKSCSYLDEIITSVVITSTIFTFIICCHCCMKCTRRNRYKLETIYHKLRLAYQGQMTTADDPVYDVYLCYIHSDDLQMEEIREFLEDKSNLKCCIPQRDFSFTATDDVTEIEQGIEQSSTTLVL